MSDLHDLPLFLFQLLGFCLLLPLCAQIRSHIPHKYTLFLYVHSPSAQFSLSLSSFCFWSFPSYHCAPFLPPPHISIDRVLTCSQLHLICAYINLKYVHLPIKYTSSYSSHSLCSLGGLSIRRWCCVWLCKGCKYILMVFFSLLECHLSPKDPINWLIIVLRLTRWNLISGCQLHQLTPGIHKDVGVLMKGDWLCISWWVDTCLDTKDRSRHNCKTLLAYFRIISFSYSHNWCLTSVFCKIGHPVLIV